MKKSNVITVNITKEALANREELRLMPNKEVLLKEKFEPLRKQVLESKVTPFPQVETRNKLEKETFGGFDVYTLCGDDYDKIVYYLHGGAWVFDILKEHVEWCDDLVDRLNAKVYLPKYPLAPVYSYKETYEMLMGLYDELLKQNKPIYIMGDSAGGQLTLAVTSMCKQTGRKMPKGIVPLSPAVEMSFTNPAALEVEVRDPMLGVYGCVEFAKMWAKDLDLKDPALSIINADLTGFPKTLLFASTDDFLGPDDFEFAEKLEASGCDILLVRGEGLWHVFSISNTPERKRSLDIIQTFCR